MNLKINVLFAAAVLSMGASGFAMAAADAQAGIQDTSAASATSSVKLTSGEIRKVDAEQGKLTIKHEAIENLEMPAMTMVFKADKPELLKNVQVGDKVRFRAEKVAGAITVTDIQAVK